MTGVSWWPEDGGATPLLKWTGGKGKELPWIRQAAPCERPARVIEPFFGGGSIGLSLPRDIPVLAGDASRDLILLYGAMKARDPVMAASLQGMDALMDAVWTDDRAAEAAASRQLGDLFGIEAYGRTIRRRIREGKARREAWSKERSLSSEDVVSQGRTGAMGGVYTALRDAFGGCGGGARAAVFWYLREFAFNGMHRFNASGGFNAPYGGRTYDLRRMGRRWIQMERSMPWLERTEFRHGDFSGPLGEATPRDLVVLDPPYDSPFSSYDGNAFGRDHHARLAGMLRDTPARWMIVIAETDFVRDTYATLPGTTTTRFAKRYQGSIKGRYSGDAVHLVVTNYPRQDKGSAAP